MIQKIVCWRLVQLVTTFSLIAGHHILPAAALQNVTSSPDLPHHRVPFGSFEAFSPPTLHLLNELDNHEGPSFVFPQLALQTPTFDGPRGETQDLECEPKELPDWVNTKPSVGISTESREKAEAHAREQAIKNLEVELQSDFKSFEGETTGGKYVYSIESVIVEKVDISIAGLEITNVFIDECGGKYYALAVIDVPKAVNAWKHDLREIDSTTAALRNQLEEREQHGQLFEKLHSLFRLVQEEEMGEKIEKRIVYVTKQPHSGDLRSGTVVETLNQYQSLLGSFRVEASGDHQQAIVEPRLPEPLTLRVLAGDRPLEQVPVNFVVKEGSILMRPSSGATDKEGKVQVKGTYAGDTTQPARILAQVDLIQISQGFPHELQDQLNQRTKQFSYEFQALPPVYHLVRNSSELTEEAKKLQQEADRFLKEGDPIQTLISLQELMNTQKSWEANAERLEDLYDPIKAEAYLVSVGDPAETQRTYEGIIASMSFEVKAGNRQEAQMGRPLQDPLVAQIMANLSEREVPIGRFPVRFAFEEGKGEVDEFTMTNDEGLATAIVTKVHPAPSLATVVAIIVWERLPASFPESLRSDLKPKLTQAKFTLTPPWGCKTEDPFDNGLYQVGCELAEQVNDSRGKETIVKEFIWSKTRERTALSHRMEINVSRALALTGMLRVIQREDDADDANVEIPSNVQAVVSGEYGLDHQKRGLWVDAKLVRKENGEVESYLRERRLIPRSHLPQEALAALEEQEEDTNSSQPLPSPKPTQQYDDWVEQFWHAENPKANFSVELKPDRTHYRVGEKAQFRFRTTRDCYLTLVNIGTSGKWIMLLPNSEQSDPFSTLVKAGSERVIPSPEDPYEFEIGEPLGVERIKAICTTKPSPIAEGIDLSQGFFSLSSQGRNWRDIRPIAKKQSKEPDDWATANAQINTLHADQKEPAGLTIMRSRGLAIED